MAGLGASQAGRLPAPASAWPWPAAKAVGKALSAAMKGAPSVGNQGMQDGSVELPTGRGTVVVGERLGNA